MPPRRQTSSPPVNKSGSDTEGGAGSTKQQPISAASSLRRQRGGGSTNAALASSGGVIPRRRSSSRKGGSSGPGNRPKSTAATSRGTSLWLCVLIEVLLTCCVSLGKQGGDDADEQYEDYEGEDEEFDGNDSASGAVDCSEDILAIARVFKHIPPEVALKFPSNSVGHTFGIWNTGE